MIKASKDEVDYTDHGSYKEHCSKCEHFTGQHTCKIVKGNVAPGGWCKRWLKITS